MSNSLSIPKAPGNIPENLTERRLAAIRSMENFIQLATSGKPLAQEIFRLVYLFKPYVLKDGEQKKSLGVFIQGYSNDHIVSYILTQLEKTAALLYGIEEYKIREPFLMSLQNELRAKAAQKVLILKKWLEAQTDETIIQIAGLDDITVDDLLHAGGYGIAANYHLYDVNSESTSRPTIARFESGVYDLNYTPDIIARTAEIFTYIMWKDGNIPDAELLTNVGNPPLEYNEFMQEWWERNQTASRELERLKQRDGMAAYDYELVIMFHQRMSYTIEVARHISDQGFKEAWLQRYLQELDHRVLVPKTMLSRGIEFLKSAFSGVLLQNLSDYEVEEIRREIETAQKGES